jgi:hypothetical protein
MRITETMQVPFKASIRMPPPARPAFAAGRRAERSDNSGGTWAGGGGCSFGAIPLSASPPARFNDRDSAGGEGENPVLDAASITSALLASAGPVPEAPPGGGPVALPDLVMPESLAGRLQDAVAATLTYAAAVSQTGAVPPFGETTASFNMTGIVVTPHPAAPPAPGPAPDGGAAPPAPGRFDVTATVSSPIHWNTASGGRTNIASETDAAITHANYPTVASDLTPNMGDLGGRSPRTQFWASDLTVIHEQFHVTELQTFGAAAVPVAQTWLNGQVAGSVTDVQNLLAQVPGRVITQVQANMALPGAEQRAYGAGAPAYQARATAITTRGTGGLYPGAPPRPAPAPAPGPAPGAPAPAPGP